LEIAYIRWRDATIVTDWHQRVDLTTPEFNLEVVSVGFVTYEDPNFISLTRDWAENNEAFRDSLVIPKAQIIERKNLGLAL
jgi:hypothetical protein